MGVADFHPILDILIALGLKNRFMGGLAKEALIKKLKDSQPSFMLCSYRIMNTLYLSSSKGSRQKLDWLPEYVSRLGVFV